MRVYTQMRLLIQEFVAMQLLNLAMWIAPREMELAIALGLKRSFEELVKRIGAGE